LRKFGKKIVIIGIGNIGFTLIKELHKRKIPIEIIAIDRILHKYLRDYLNSNSDFKIEFIKMDILDRKNIHKNLKKECFKNINVLVSTIGYMSSSYEFGKYKKEFNINFFGNIIPIKILIDNIQKNKNNRVIIISSISGNKATKHVNSYAPAKWALESFSSSLQQEYANNELFIDVVRPDNIFNKYSNVFKINKGIDAKVVVNKIINLIQFSITGSPKKGKKFFIPFYLFGARIIDRVFPFVFDKYYGLKSKRKRKKTYGKYNLNRVLILGVSSKIGKELAKTYSKFSKEIIIIDQVEQDLVDLKNELNKESRCNIIIKKIDLKTILDLKNFLNNIGEVNLFINNSNHCFIKSVKKTTIDEYVETLDVNFFSPVLIIQNLIANNFTSKIINLVSFEAIRGRENYSAYSSSKAALWSYTRSMRRQKGNKIHFLEVIFSTDELNSLSSSNPYIINEAREGVNKILKAERAGNDIIYVPNKLRSYLLIEAVSNSLFNFLFLTKKKNKS